MILRVCASLPSSQHFSSGAIFSQPPCGTCGLTEAENSCPGERVGKFDEVGISYKVPDVLEDESPMLSSILEEYCIISC